MASLAGLVRTRGFDGRAILGVKRDAQTGSSSVLQPAKQFVRVWSRKVARGRPHKSFQADHQSRSGKVARLSSVLTQKPENPEVAVGGQLGQGQLLARALDRVRWRDRVGHVEHRRHAAEDRARACR